MPAFASFAVNDRAATPVAHTFAPRSKDPVPTWCEAGSMPAGERKFTLFSRKSGEKYRITLRLSNPTVVTEVINGVSVPKVARTQYAETTFTFTSDSTLQERKDTVGMHMNAFGASVIQIDSALTALEAIW